MILIPEEQALQRWDTLPDNLREALCAEINSDFIWKTCGDEHVPDEKIYAVARIAGYVLMGFLHPDDASKEIQDATGLDPRIADPIARAIDARIFAPLRQNIDGIYEPANKPGSGSRTVGGGPIMIEEIQKPIMTSPPAPRMSQFMPLPSKAPSAESRLGVGGQAGRIALESSMPVSPIPNKNSGTQTPKPVILQEGTPFEPNKKSSGFHVEISEDKMKGLSNIPRPAPIKPAALELGGPIGNAPWESSQPSRGYGGQAGRIQSPEPVVNKAGSQASEKNRTITEITFPSQFSERKSGEQTPKNISAIPLPSKITGASLEGRAPSPIQIPAGKPADQIKATPLMPAAVVPIPQPPSPLKISEGNLAGQVLPIKPTVIQKDYSETDVSSEIPTPKKFPPKT
jgi:hypothetical protein